jgi:hypothetical protein
MVDAFVIAGACAGFVVRGCSAYFSGYLPSMQVRRAHKFAASTDFADSLELNRAPIA